jgi:sulfoxide reductase heme-binding subunit YedZ
VLSGRALWYLTRGTGIVSLILLTASMVLGILEVRRWARPGWPRLLTAGLHRNVSLLSVAFVGAHIVTAVLDRYAPLRWVDSVVPFLSGYRPIWLGLGTLSLDLMAAVVVTSLLRARVRYRAWRAVHWLSYASWPVALVHSVGTGSDIRQPWMLALLAGCLVAVLGAALWRLASGTPATAGARLAGGLAALVALGGVAGWTAAGPLQAGWAARAGTPPTLLGSASSAATSSASGLAAPAAGGGAQPATGAAAALAPPFTASFAGTLSSVQSAPAEAAIRIQGVLSGGASGELAVTISGTPAGDGIAMASSSVSLGPAGQPARYTGQLVSLSGSDFVASVADGAGQAMTLTATLTIDRGSGAVAGSVTGAAVAG